MSTVRARPGGQLVHSPLGASEQIAAQIRVWLEQQQLQTGERIGTEQELADEFGVSRPTMREALRLLSAAHLIRVGRGRTGGIFVARTPSEGMSRNLSESIALMLAAQTISMTELLDARLSLEVPIAGRAAVNADDGDRRAPGGGDRGRGRPPARHRAVQHRRQPLPPDPRRGVRQRPPARADGLDPRGPAAVARGHDLAPRRPRGDPRPAPGDPARGPAAAAPGRRARHAGAHRVPRPDPGRGGVSEAGRPGNFRGVMTESVAGSTNPARLDPEQRDAALARMREETFDVVVIGGGATGTGCALDAASRGLSVALVEARDFASGTSSRSSKLIHGGLRYLEQMEFGLVREALRERGLLLNVIAPHLVRPVPFLLPAGAAGLGARLRRRRDAALRRARRPQGPAPPSPSDQAPGAADRPGAQARRADRRASSTGTPRSTTPATRSPSRARPPPTAPPSPPAPPSSASCARASASPACACSTTSPTRSSTSRRARSSTRPACGPTTSSTWSASAASSRCAPPRASTSSSRATASRSTPG